MRTGAIVQRGLAAVEFALLLPLMLFLLLGVIELARVIQADMILANLSREAANLASRGTLQLSDNAQGIIGSVASTAAPLDMNKSGMIYITKVMGMSSGSSGTRSAVLEQYRWDDSANTLGFRASGYAPVSKVYTCPAWSSSTSGSCVVPNTYPTVPVMSGQLSNGEVIYVVEAYYKYSMLFSSYKVGAFAMPTVGPDLYSYTVF